MAFNDALSDKVRELLADRDDVTEMKMFGGLCFMVDKKMCIGIVKDELMCRLNPETYESVLDRPGCREMDFTGKRMKGFVYVDESGFNSQKDLAFWVDLCLEFNPLAKASKKR